MSSCSASPASAEDDYIRVCELQASSQVLVLHMAICAQSLALTFTRRLVRALHALRKITRLSTRRHGSTAAASSTAVDGDVVLVDANTGAALSTVPVAWKKRNSMPLLASPDTGDLAGGATSRAAHAAEASAFTQYRGVKPRSASVVHPVPSPTYSILPAASPLPSPAPSPTRALVAHATPSSQTSTPRTHQRSLARDSPLPTTPVHDYTAHNTTSTGTPITTLTPRGSVLPSSTDSHDPAASQPAPLAWLPSSSLDPHAMQARADILTELRAQLRRRTLRGHVFPCALARSGLCVYCIALGLYVRAATRFWRRVEHRFLRYVLSADVAAQLLDGDTPS